MSSTGGQGPHKVTAKWCKVMQSGATERTTDYRTTDQRNTELGTMRRQRSGEALASHGVQNGEGRMVEDGGWMVSWRIVALLFHRDSDVFCCSGLIWLAGLS